MKNFTRETARAFTLIELLIAVALFSLLSVSAGSLLIGVQRAERTNIAVSQVEIEGNYVLYQIAQSIRNASGITAPSAGASSTSLTLALANVTGQNPTIVALSGTVVTHKKGTGPAIALTTKNVRVTAFSALNMTASSTRAVRLVLTVAYTNPSNLPEQAYSKTFYTTVTLR